MKNKLMKYILLLLCIMNSCFCLTKGQSHMNSRDLIVDESIQFDKNVKIKSNAVTLLNNIFTACDNDVLIDLKNDVGMMNINVSEMGQYYHVIFSPRTDDLNYDVSFLIDKNTGKYLDVVTGAIRKKTKNN